MDGIHDLGGKQGFGAVETQTPKDAFEARWQASVFAMVRALSAAGITKNTDQFRHAIERIDPISYLSDGYYGRWLGGVETLLVEAGAISQAEIDAKMAELGYTVSERVAARPADAAEFDADSLLPGARRELNEPAKFAVGDWVITNAQGWSGHTRLPAYARGKRGQISAVHGGWVFPDDNAHGRGTVAHLYTVCFARDTLFNDETTAGDQLSLDLFEPYLTASENSNG